MRALIATAIAAIGIGAFSVGPAEARFYAPALEAPSLIEQAQCVTRTVRTRRPNGTVVVRRVQDCGRRPGVVFVPPVVRVAPACRTVRTTARRNGRTVVTTRRVC